MAELKYKCLDFIIEPRKVLLEFTYKDGILISIPFLDNIGRNSYQSMVKLLFTWSFNIHGRKE